MTRAWTWCGTRSTSTVTASRSGDRVEPLVEPDVLRAYLAHVTLVCTDWAIRLRPDDVPRQLARADRVLARYAT